MKFTADIHKSNTPPLNRILVVKGHAVSMFETMGGTADDIAGQNKANPVALIDSAAEMLLHIGGKENIIAAELIKTSILEVLADGYYVGDIKKHRELRYILFSTKVRLVVFNQRVALGNTAREY